MLGLSFYSKLVWGSCTASIANTASMKIEGWFVLWRFVLWIYQVALHGTLLSYLGVAPSCHLDMLNKLKKRVCRIVDPSRAAYLAPLVHLLNIASISLFYRCYLVDVHLTWLKVSLPHSSGRSTFYSNRSHDFSVTILRCYKVVYDNDFFSHTDRLRNYLPIECFLLTYDLNSFTSRVSDAFHLWVLSKHLSYAFHLFLLLFLVIPCYVVGVQTCMEWFPTKKNMRKMKTKRHRGKNFPTWLRNRRVLKIFAKFTAKSLCHSLVFNKVIDRKTFLSSKRNTCTAVFFKKIRKKIPVPESLF